MSYLVLHTHSGMAELMCDPIYWEDFAGTFSLLLLAALSISGLTLLLLKRREGNSNASLKLFY